MGGPVGLDLTVYLHELDRKGVPDEEREAILRALQVIEAVALEKIYET